MSKITYKPQMVRRPIVVNPGFEGSIDCNQMKQYFGEWVSFLLPMGPEGSFGELRLPLEEALEQGLVMTSDHSILENEE